MFYFYRHFKSIPFHFVNHPHLISYLFIILCFSFSSFLYGVYACLNFILKEGSQRSFSLKQLRCQGLSRQQLSIIFDAMILSRLRYALPAWAGFLTKEAEGRIDAFQRRMFQYEYCCHCYSIRDLIANCDERLYKSVTQHCLNILLKSLSISLSDSEGTITYSFCAFLNVTKTHS